MLRFALAMALAACVLALPAIGYCAEPAAPADPAAPVVQGEPADKANQPASAAAPVSSAAATAPPVDKVTLDARGLDIDNLLQFYSRTFSITIIKDPNLTGPVTIMCPQPVSRQEAFDTLNAVLAVRGFTCLFEGNVLKIVPLAKAVQSNVGLSVGRSSDQQGDMVITQLVPLKNADAVQLQTDLAPLIGQGASLIANSASNTLTITDYASNVTRLLRIIDQLDSTNALQVRVFPLTYAQATDVATLLTQVFFTAPRGTQTGGGRQLPGFLARLAGARSGATGATGGVTAVPFGQAVADTRTNSVIVSTSKERMEALGEVIKGLDRPVERKGNLTVIALQRANAQDVANALNQALGARVSGQTGTTASRTTSRASTRSGSSSPFAGSISNLNRNVGSRAYDAPLPAASTSGRAEALPAESTAAPAPTVIAQAGPPPAAPEAADYAEAQLGNTVQLGGNATVVAEPNTNSLIITATPEYALLVKQLVEQLDQASPQVLIEAIVAEVSLDAERKLGFEWKWLQNSVLGNSNLSSTASTGFGLATETTGLSWAITGTHLSSLLHALASDDTVSILSTPRIFTSNNRAAEINISTWAPYVSGTAFASGIAQTSVDYLNVGVILQVTPQISPDGTVSMQVVQQANDLLRFEDLGNGLRAPTVAGRSASATVRVADGQTVILGGIMSDNVIRSVDKVPLLGDLPVVGGLFRHTTTSKKKSELLVFLTPKVVRTPEEAAALTQAEKAKSLAPVPNDAAKGAH
jgi:general secretion pathway protein D